MRDFLRRWLGIAYLDNACRGLVHPRSLQELYERVTTLEHAVTRLDAMERLIEEEKKAGMLPALPEGQSFSLKSDPLPK